MWLIATPLTTHISNIHLIVKSYTFHSGEEISEVHFIWVLYLFSNKYDNKHILSPFPGN